MPFHYKCYTCGSDTIKNRRSSASKNFCCNTCKFKSYEKREKTRHCAHCGKEFMLNRDLSIARLAKAIYCSKSCKTSMRFGSVDDRFWKQVDKTESCWNWIGHSADGRYGLIGYNKRQHPAHRYAWERERGPIPDGLSVLHRCDNPKCVRIDHLFLGTQLDNMRDMINKGRAYHQKRVIK